MQSQTSEGQPVHAFKASEHYVPYSRCAELGIYPHIACGSMLILEERSHTSAEYHFQSLHVQQKGPLVL